LVSRTTGSLVYRGEQFPSLAGTLLFASHDGQLLALRGGEQGTPGRLAKVDLGRFGERRFSGLRQGPRGELILLCEDGQVFEMRKGASLGTGGSKQKSMFCDAGTVAMPRG
jgi:glucose/arabinose dehydrogenase